MRLDRSYAWWLWYERDAQRAYWNRKRLAARRRPTPLPAPKPGTHASHFGPWFDAIGNDPVAWQRAAVWSHAGGAA